MHLIWIQRRRAIVDGYLAFEFGGAMITRRIYRFISPLLAGVCVWTGLNAATTGLAAAADAPCEYPDDPGFAVGVPTVALPEGQSGDFGRVDLYNASGDGLVIQRTSLGEEPQEGDRFGAAIVLADLDADNCFDLVVGAPGVNGGGAVYVIYGTRAGAGTGASVRIPLPARSGDAFGEAVAVEPFMPQPTQGRSARIWIGAPGRDVSGQSDAGAVAYTELVDRVASTPRLYTQNSSAVPGQAEAGDRFGEQLAALHSNPNRGGGVLVGQPSEDIGAHQDAGMVTVLPAPGASPAGAGPFGVTQDSPGIPGAVETGDRFGAAVDTDGNLGWVGVPNEDFGALRDVGMVHGLRIGATKVASYSDLHQGLGSGLNLPGTPEAGDQFGANVRARPADPDYDCSEPGVIIGIPGEDVGAAKDAGEVDTYFGRGRDVYCLEGAGFNLGANAHPGDRLGAAVGRKRAAYLLYSEEMLVGIPGYDLATAVDAGVVLQGLAARENRPAVVHTQTRGAVPGSHYGAVLNR